jgi:hypothetical protein
MPNLIIHGTNGITYPDSTVQESALTTGAQVITGVKTFSSAPTFGSASMPTPSGTAPVYGCRAWCTFNGTTAGTNAPTAGGNVTSITRVSTGVYTINFTTAMPDAAYLVVMGSVGGLVNSQTKATGTCGLNASLPATGTQYDPTEISVAIFR